MKVDEQMPNDTPLPSASRRNIDTTIQIEQGLLERRSRSDQIGQAVVGFFGSLRFVIAHVLIVAAWVIFNTETIGLVHFDPYPFPLLSLVVGLEFILLTTFVLMNQKHEMRRNEHWAHLHLHLSMLVEQEQTKGLQLLQKLCRHARLDESVLDQEVKDLSQTTKLAELASEIDRAREEVENRPVDGE